jgi:PAS domain S-box-containing protein
MEKTGTKTELKVAQKTIKIFETFLHAYTDGIAITDFSHNTIVVNEALCNFLSKDYQEVTETNLFDWLEQLDGDAVKKWAKMEGVVRKEGESRDVEFAKTANDTVLYLNVNASVLERAGEDETDVIVSIWRDVTEHKQAEEALVHAAEDWQETFDAVDDLVAIVDSERNILRANRAMKEVFGDIDFKEKKCYELFHGIDEYIPFCPCTRSFESGELEHLEIREPHLDNHIFDVFTYPIRVEEGSIQKVVHVVRDITDRKRAEEELNKTKEELEVRVDERTSELTEANKKLQLEITDRKRAEEVIRESEEKYRLLVENANDGIVSIQNGLIKFANTRVEELGGSRLRN